MGNIHQINNYQILPIYHPGPISPKSHKANIPIFETLKKKYQNKKNNNTHVDFLIINKVTKEYRLAIEVDGGYHNPFNNANKQQVHNDELKNSIFKKANLLLMRCKTDEIPNESGIIKNLR